MTARTRFCLVRHGETTWNVDRRIQGQVDIPLNDTGLAQAQATAQALLGERIDTIYGSDLGRAWVTAGRIAVPRGLLATFGVVTPWPVGENLWSWCANGATYGLVGGLMVAEFLYRSRRFPDRYHGPLDFARRMAALGPGFWNGLFRNGASH